MEDFEREVLIDFVYYQVEAAALKPLESPVL
jgi:hypothetical protein